MLPVSVGVVGAAGVVAAAAFAGGVYYADAIVNQHTPFLPSLRSRPTCTHISLLSQTNEWTGGRTNERTHAHTHTHTGTIVADRMSHVIPGVT